jgi:TetR/AcrR family transcriptional repressor of nem operon
VTDAEDLARPSRSLTDRGLETRARIVQSAAQLMFEQGIGATSVEHVRQAACVSGSQMTHYFRDKRTLIRAVIAWQTDRIIDFNTQAGATALDSFEALRDWADRHIEMQMARDLVIGCRLGGLAGQLGAYDEQTRLELEAGFDRWAQVVRAGLLQMRERAVLRADAPIESLTTAVVAAHQGGALMAQVERDITPLRDALNGVLDYIASYATVRRDDRPCRSSESTAMGERDPLAADHGNRAGDRSAQPPGPVPARPTNHPTGISNPPRS